MNRKINILWLDEQFKGRKLFVEMAKTFITQKYNINIIEVSSVEEFSFKLESRHALSILDKNYIDIIWIDCMIPKLKNKANFEALGFMDIEQKPLICGLQVLMLIQNEDYFEDQVDWLQSYRDRQTSIVSNKIGVDVDINKFINNPKRAKKFKFILKNSEYENYVEKPDILLISHLEFQINYIKNNFRSENE